jgi:hypothetical protein
LNIGWPFYDDILESKNKLNITDDAFSFKKVLPKFRGSIDYIGFENDVVKIRGWGLVNYSRPLKHIFLEFEGNRRLKFEIVERTMREDVNDMLNVKGVILGFSAKVKRSDLRMFKGSSVGVTLVTFLDSQQCFFKFDMLKKNKEFDYFALSELVG